jgi:hypothetical protein
MRASVASVIAARKTSLREAGQIGMIGDPIPTQAVTRSRAARGTRLSIVLAAVLLGCASVESRPPVTTEQVIQLSKQGVPPADIIQKMRDSGTVYRLSGSQLGRLKSEGVDDEVLDYMQDTYLAAARMRGSAEYGSYWGSPWAWGPYPYSYWGPRGYWGSHWGPYYPYPPHRYRNYRPRPAPSGARPPSPPPVAGAPPPPRPRPSGGSAPRQQRN